MVAYQGLGFDVRPSPVCRDIAASLIYVYMLQPLWYGTSNFAVIGL